MENASKALLIAGGVLLSLMVISLLIYMFNGISSFQSEEIDAERQAQIVNFNNGYETYNREDVRGSDLYSLLNKVIDYNTRKSTEGSAEGKELSYQEMTVDVKIATDIEKKYTPDNASNRLIKAQEYQASKMNNSFKTDVIDKINSLTVKISGVSFSEKQLTSLAAGLTKIFIEEPTGNDQNKKVAKIKAINNFNSAYGSKELPIDSDTNIDDSWNKIKKGSDICENVYTYYEYVQFKRNIFKCTGTEYNKNTGRIIKMTFEATNSFE